MLAGSVQMYGGATVATRGCASPSSAQPRLRRASSNGTMSAGDSVRWSSSSKSGTAGTPDIGLVPALAIRRFHHDLLVSLQPTMHANASGLVAGPAPDAANLLQRIMIGPDHQP